MYTIERKGARPVRVWTHDIAHDAMEQLVATAKLPCVGPHVAAMPDVHPGIGATVGSVIPTRAAVIPAAVGVDIGCGMLAVELNRRVEDLPNSLRDTRLAMEEKIRVDTHVHEDVVAKDRAKRLERGLKRIVDRTPAIAARRSGIRMEHVFRSLGTMGGGNHFLELQRSATGSVWLMLHSGSREIGSRIGLHFIAEAKERIELERIDPPSRDLAWLDEGSDAFERYFEAVLWAQDYARENRLAMLDLALAALRTTLGEDLAPVRVAVSCHHNYVERERHRGEDLYVTRKGAIRAGKGELGIIPGSMGARSYIVRGLGNPDAFDSAAHGAGRRMSRGEAKAAFDLDDVELQTEGVECRKDAGVIDELPGAYRDIDQVMENQRDLVEIVETLKQLVCVKG